MKKPVKKLVLRGRYADDLIYDARVVDQVAARIEKDLSRRSAALPAIPEDAKEHTLNFMQVVGPAIPLCWIPVDDVKAVAMLLAMHQPKSESLKIVQAQFNTAIENLNKYINEAIERNNRPNTFSTTMVAEWTKPETGKGKKK